MKKISESLDKMFPRIKKSTNIKDLLKPPGKPPAKLQIFSLNLSGNLFSTTSEFNDFMNQLGRNSELENIQLARCSLKRPGLSIAVSGQPTLFDALL
jgi:hypothetical protein